MPVSKDLHCAKEKRLCTSSDPQKLTIYLKGDQVECVDDNGDSIEFYAELRDSFRVLRRHRFNLKIALNEPEREPKERQHQILPQLNMQFVNFRDFQNPLAIREANKLSLNEYYRINLFVDEQKYPNLHLMPHPTCFLDGYIIQDTNLLTTQLTNEIGLSSFAEQFPSYMQGFSNDIGLALSKHSVVSAPIPGFMLQVISESVELVCNVEVETNRDESINKLEKVNNSNGS
ncbi:MAG: hypothetical protein MHMPM18_002064 [Marteilia pararefringens]